MLLLLHGTGAATHSWRDLAPLLAQQFRVVAPDLPGHGFSQLPSARLLSLPEMADAVGRLLQELDAIPAMVVGHSAGAAVAVRLALNGHVAPLQIAGLNSALLPLRGLPGHLFSPLARLLAANPLVPRLFSWRARDRAMVERLVASTGSALGPTGVELYGRLIGNRRHVAATLGMMARWDLRPLQRDLPKLRTPLALIVGSNDRTVAPEESRRVQALLPGATVLALPGLGHLAHEEQPQEVAKLLARLAQTAGVLPTSP